MELKKISGIDTAVAEVVKGLEEVKAGIKADLAPYKNGVVTAETCDAWKKDRTALNKERTGYETERKSIVAGWKEKVQPIVEAYAGIKAEYDEAIGNIDTQLDEFEKKRIAEKRAEIQKAFDEMEKPDGLEDWLTLDAIYAESWDNKSTSMKAIKTAIKARWTQLENAVQTVKDTRSCIEYINDGLKVLKETGDVSKALAEVARLERAENLFRERAEREAREKAEREAREHQEREAREKAEREAREKAEQEAREKAEREAQEAQQEAQVEQVEPKNLYPFGNTETVAKESGEMPFGMPEPVSKFKLTVVTEEITDAQYEELMRTLTACGLTCVNVEVM